MNEKGQLTTEFMFAIVVAFGLFMLFFAMSFTFSVIEVSQYIVYSTARTHAAGNLDQITQKQEAMKKFNSLRNSPALSSLYAGNWFVFGPITDNGFRQGEDQTFANEFSRTDGGSADYLKVFVGVSVPLEAKIMNIKIPFIMDTSAEDSIFKTNVNTIMLREVTQIECQTHVGDTRKNALRNLKSGSQFYVPAKYFRMEDNGC